MKIIICGGGIGGSFVANGIAGHIGRDISSVTLVEPRTYFEAPNGVIGAAHHPNYVQEFNVIAKQKEWAWDQRIIHVASKIAEVDAQSNTVRLENGHSLEYDILCIATGTKSLPQEGIWRPSSTVTTLDARLKEIENYRSTLAQSKTVMVVGGGIVGVELISELSERYPTVRFHYVVADNEVLSQFPSIVRIVARRHIQRFRNVQMHMGTGRIGEPGADGVYHIGKFEIRPDLVIKCFPGGLNTHFLPAEWLDEKKQVKVDTLLRVEGTSNVFAIGDIANITSDKSAKAALDQAIVVKRNILNLCKKRKPVSTFLKPREGLVIRLGPRESLMYFKPLLGLYGVTLSGSYLADVIRVILLARIVHDCSTGRSTNLVKGPRKSLTAAPA